MLLSRFWYVFAGLFTGVLVFLLFLGLSVYNRAVGRSLQEGLIGDSQVVSWYMKNDARERASQLIKFATNQDIARGLSESSRADTIPEKSRDAVKSALIKVAATIPQEDNFDALFAVDQNGRVVAYTGYDQALGVDDFELGGYSVVADALHGYIRDDTLLLDRPYRVVARPIEYDLGQLPAGAIVGARMLDERFARDLSERTGAAVAFFVGENRIAAAATGSFDKLLLDQVTTEISTLTADQQFKEKGISSVLPVRGTPLAVIYGRIPGETWQLGVGYVVAREARDLTSVVGFFSHADDTDKHSVPLSLVLLISVLVMGLGIVFSVLEHTLPLKTFSGEAHRFAKGEITQLQTSRFRSVLRRVASDLNDGIEHAIAQGGGSRRAADLKQVIGDIPDQPQMSAFSLPLSGSPPAAVSSVPAPVLSETPVAPTPANRPPPPPRHRDGNEPTLPQAQRPEIAEELDAETEHDWHGVFAEFVRVKQSCGEATEGLTFDKFKQTLRKNRSALMQRHGAVKVKFSVYVKDGRAALKANPIRE